MADNVKQILFGDLDFSKLRDDHEFKEDSVREVIILPVLEHLGYRPKDIVRSKSLVHPFLKMGSNKKRPIELIPDYVMKVEENYAWVLDAKGPRENILDDDYVGQVYSYAVHPEICSTYFALCNGLEFRGNASVFAYYRYRIAPRPVELDLMKYFDKRLKRVLAAKKEMRFYINEDTKQNLQIVKGSATNLDFLANESVDYIYTDPPYADKIPYLDLSAMWYSWLDLDVTESDYQSEAIEGGDHKKSKEEYKALIAKSIEEMYRVLKFDRWMSFVFAHKDPEFWHLIIDTAERCGFEYVGAVPQKNGQSSFKKRQNPFTVLSGQLIINFRKVRNPKTIMKAHLGIEVADIVMQTIEGVIAKNNGATLEQINDELIVKGLELGFLDLMKKEYSDLTPLLMNNFDYDEKTETFFIRKDTKFSTHIDVNLRIRYYLISLLRRKEREGRNITFDEIVMEIIPLLKNGTTPESQTILKVLEDIGQRTGDNFWRLKKKVVQLELF